MPRPTSTPSYCLHATTGHAYATFAGRQIWLGKHGTPESRAKYDRLIGEWLLNGRRAPAIATTAGPTVSTVLAAFLDHAKGYYAAPGDIGEDGKPVLVPTREYDNFVESIRPVRRIYGQIPAQKFGPNALKVVREHLIQSGICRNVVNRRVGRIKAIFKWAVSAELIPASIYHALAALSGLRMGKTAARESEPVKPVADSIVDATLPYLSSVVASMVQVQRFTGARPGEVCIMRTADIDTGAKVWTYTPAKHKTAHHGHERIIHLGPKAREIVRPFLKPLNGLAFIFSPKDAEAERRERLSAARKTPLHRGNRPGTNKSRKPRRTPGDVYGVAEYRRAIARACDMAFPPPKELLRDERAVKLLAREKSKQPPLTATEISALAQWRGEIEKWKSEHRWHPHQLRHTAATAIRRQFGLEAAQTILGHASLSMTELYAEQNSDAARKIAAKIG